MFWLKGVLYLIPVDEMLAQKLTKVIYQSVWQE